MYTNSCAPGQYDKENDTCFRIEVLMEMAAAYNRYIYKKNFGPNKKENFDKINFIKIKPDKKYLLQEFKKRFEKICDNDQLCWTQQSFMNEVVVEMREEIINNTFRPIGPDDPTEWLSTTKINEILKQYEKIYPNFKFLEAVPRDCSQLHFCSFYKLNFDNLMKNKIKQVASVINLDKHGEPGSHWVALFIDISKGEVYFCDSTGKPPSSEIMKTINDFITYYKNKTGKDPIYEYNKIPYQKDKSECGVYSTNFIIRKLSGETFENIVKDPLVFTEINSCRNAYFRNNPSNHPIHPKCDPI
jgi:hypothetical protein